MGLNEAKRGARLDPFYFIPDGGGDNRKRLSNLWKKLSFSIELGDVAAVCDRRVCCQESGGHRPPLQGCSTGAQLPKPAKGHATEEAESEHAHRGGFGDGCIG